MFRAYFDVTTIIKKENIIYLREDFVPDENEDIEFDYSDIPF